MVKWLTCWTSNPVVPDRFLGGENTIFFSMFIQWTFCKKQWGQNASFCYFGCLECSSCQRVGGCGLGQKVLLRTSWNLIYCVPGLIQGLGNTRWVVYIASAKFWNARVAFMESFILVTCFCPVYLVDELILMFCTPSAPWRSNGGSFEVFQHIVSVVWVLWGVGCVLWDRQ